MKKFLMYIGIFASVGAMITVITLGYLDNFIYKIAQNNSFNIKHTNNAENKPKIFVDTKATNLQISYDNKYYTYLQENKIYINNIEDGKNIKIIEETEPIVGYELLYDKNMILYFTEDKKTTSSNISLMTYEIELDRKSEYTEYTIQGFDKIKEINMSPVINIIYINMDIKNGNKVTNTVYKIDLFKAMTKVTSGVTVDKIIMLQHKDRICYEDSNSNVYLSGSKLNIFNEKVELIGLDLDDNLYFLSKDKKDKVYKVQNSKIIKTINLESNEVVNTYSNNDGVYLIYDDYILNIAAEKPLEKIGLSTTFAKFIAIKGDKSYYLTQDNMLINSMINNKI